MKKKGTQSRRVEEAHFGASFDARRTEEAHGDTSVLLENRVSLSVPSGSTHFDVLTLIAQKSAKPIPVGSLSEELKKLKLPRGRTCIGDPAGEIEAIVSNYRSLRWWLTEQGLVVDEVLSELDSLSSFDRLVGPLSVQRVQNGILREEAVRLISEKLAAEGFELKKHLQPKEWEAIVAHNRKRTGRQVESFASAVKDPRFVRHVRRSISVRAAVTTRPFASIPSSLDCPTLLRGQVPQDRLSHSEAARNCHISCPPCYQILAQTSISKTKQMKLKSS